MLFRKAEKPIREFLEKRSDKVLIVSGARQVGKSFLIRHVGKNLFKNFIEINLIEDYQGRRLFEEVRTIDDFYLTLSMLAGSSLGGREDTLIFLDEIQQYPQLLTLLKFLRQDNRYCYVASGSLLGVSLRQSVSIPIGSIEILQMYPLDFEEFLIANGVGKQLLDYLKECFDERKSPEVSVHEFVLELFKKYLLVGGMPDAVNAYRDTRNIVKVREVQRTIRDLYALDAGQYDEEHKLKIKRIYELIPSNLENKKKRLFFSQVEGRPARSKEYMEEIDYLISSGVALEVKAVSNPVFPLTESSRKNLLKLYLNDVGLLTEALYKNNIKAVLSDENGVNLGSVYECAVAMELASLGHSLFYYDNRHKGEVDFLVDNYEDLSVIPIEVKSGKDYKRHSAISAFVQNQDYKVKFGIVLSNSGEIEIKNNLIYLPCYMSMFLRYSGEEEQDIYF